VALEVLTDVLKKPTASILYPEDGVRRFLRSIGHYFQYKPRRSTYVKPSKTKIGDV
jgi:hypothetical protein